MRTPRRGYKSAFVDLLEPRRLLTTWYVDASSAAPAPNGNSWSTAYPDLQLALAAATAGDTIKVAQGTYKPTSTADRTLSFNLKSGVAIYGGFAGSTSVTPDARDLSLYPSLLSGDIGVPGDYADNSYHILTATGVDTSTLLDGFTVTAGNASGTTTATRRGGALVVSSGSPTIANTTFTRNRATSDGGALWISNASPTFLKSSFYGNSAGSGGALAAEGSTDNSYRFNNCAFVGNTARHGAVASTWNTPMAPAFIGCTFTANVAGGYGGVIYDIYSRNVTFTNSILWGNAALSGRNLYLGSGTTPAVTYSNLDTPVTGTGNISADPLFLRAPSPGPDGTWGTTDDDYGDLRLSAASPAADAGNNAAVTPAITADLAGAPRFQDIPTTPDIGAGTPPIVDMGAFEASPALAVSAGGPYVILEGQPLTLAGRAASPDPAAITYAWDFDNDGLFDDAAGPNPAFPVHTVPAGSARTISLRITDGAGNHAFSDATVRVAPAVVYVDPRASSGANNGTSWDNAFTDLAAALRVGLPGQTFRVATGTYKPTAGSDRSAYFRLPSGVAVYGSYAGLGAPDPDARDLSAPTTLSGDIGAPGVASDNTYQVLVVADNLLPSSLDGFTVTGGNADFSPGGIFGDGGGAFITRSTASFANCTFTGNSARFEGGAVFNYFASSSFTNCTFTANSADEGGAIHSYAGPLTIIDCTFSNNSARYGGAIYTRATGLTISGSSFNQNTAAFYGGAIYDSSSFPGFAISNSTFHSNTARSGGAVYVDASSNSSALNSCTFTSNSASGTGGGLGGALYSQSHVWINDCTFSANTASADGGAAYLDGFGFNNTSITNSSFTGNTAGNTAGAVYYKGSNPIGVTGSSFTANSAKSGGALYFDGFDGGVITQSIFTRNTATGSGSLGRGGAVYSSSAGPVTRSIFNSNSAAVAGGAIHAGFASGFNPPAIANSTFVGNTAPSAGAVYNGPRIVNSTFVANGATTSGGAINTIAAVANSIFWSNTAPSSPQIAGSATVTYSLVQGGRAGTGNLDADPRFRRNPSPGPDSTWGTPDDDYGDLRLLPGSPAVDAGNNAALPAGTTTDLAGNPRTFDFPGAGTPGAVTVDMGAYELTIDLGVLHLRAGQSVALPAGGHTFSTTQLTLDPGATLDLVDSSLLLAETPQAIADSAAALRTYLASAQLRSTSATSAQRLGYLDGPDSLLVKLALTGDANLDGRLTADDQALLDRGRLMGKTTWTAGDFDYDGQVTDADAALLRAALYRPAPLAPTSVVAPLAAPLPVTVEVPAPAAPPKKPAASPAKAPASKQAKPKAKPKAKPGATQSPKPIKPKAAAEIQPKKPAAAKPSLRLWLAKLPRLVQKSR